MLLIRDVRRYGIWQRNAVKRYQRINAKNLLESGACIYVEDSDFEDFEFDKYCDYIDKEYTYLEHLQDALLLINSMNGPVDLILLIKPKIAKLKMKH